MPAPGWKSISLPEEMLEKIERIIEQYPDLGYRSKADFISAAIRTHPDYQREITKKARKPKVRYSNS